MTDIASMVSDDQRRDVRALGRGWADNNRESFGPGMSDLAHNEIQVIADRYAPDKMASTMSIQILNREFTRAALERLRDLTDDPRAKKWFDNALDDGTS